VHPVCSGTDGWSGAVLLFCCRLASLSDESAPRTPSNTEPAEHPTNCLAVDHPIGFSERPGTRNDRVDDAEDGDVATDPRCQCRYHRGEYRRALTPRGRSDVLRRQTSAPAPTSFQAVNRNPSRGVLLTDDGMVL
jgi:hypothetical protein